MNKEEVDKLNTEIYTLARMIATRKNIENDTRRDIDIIKFNFKNNLDKKEFSNEEKRDAEAIKDPRIKAMGDDLKRYRYETEIMQIEYEYKLRKLNIMMS